MFMHTDLRPMRSVDISEEKADLFCSDSVEDEQCGWNDGSLGEGERRLISEREGVPCVAHTPCCDRHRQTRHSRSVSLGSGESCDRRMYPALLDRFRHFPG